MSKLTGFAREFARPLLAGALLAALAVPAQAAVTDMKQGKGGSVVQGAAGTDGGKGDTGLQHCDKPMGAIAVVEPQDLIVSSLSQYGLQSPTRLIRLMIQQSNCFIVVERGVGMQNVMQERALAGGGQLRSGSNMGGGQMVTADFVLTPSVEFSENNAGGVGGALGGFLGRKNPLLGAVAGGLKFKEAQTSMLIADARSGIQVAAAEGSSKKADLSLGAFGAGGWGGAAGGGYANTNEGKVIAASFMNNYNSIVDVVRGDASLQREVGTLKQEAGKKTVAGEVFNQGDIVTPKIGLSLLAAPADGAKAIGKLTKGAELVVIGDEKDGYLNVQGDSGSGWVKKLLVTRP